MKTMLEAGMRKRWRLKPLGPGATARSQNGIHPLVEGLLSARGVVDPPQVEHFLRPKLSDLDEPTEVPGIDAAAHRLDQALREHQSIIIYGDYDADGITASAILWHVLTRAGAQVSTYVPHRVNEGYGLQEAAIKRISRGGRALIVTVDCGITAVGPANLVKQLGMDLIITDHHHFDPTDLPDAEVIVHPSLNRSDASPSAIMCGAGVAFKLAWQFAKVHFGSPRLPAEYRELLLDLLSLMALGTIADVVPLVGENRIATVFGLARIKHTQFIGLNAMIDASGLRNQKVDAYHVGFTLAPRLNACGRMSHAEHAIELLTHADPEQAARIASLLNTENNRRRATEQSILGQAIEMVKERGFDQPSIRAIILSDPSWHPGVLGIVASRLVETFGRPTVLLQEENGWARGSARSIDGLSIHEALQACDVHLEQFGGHSVAAGLTLKTGQIEPFRQALIQFFNMRLGPDELTPLLDIDAEVLLTNCTLDLFEQIQRMAPFGRGNPCPRLLVRNATLDRPAQMIGQGGKHLLINLRQSGRVLRAVGFRMGQLADHLPSGSTIDAVFEPKVSRWQGNRLPELHLQDLRHSSN